MSGDVEVIEIGSTPTTDIEVGSPPSTPDTIELPQRIPGPQGEPGPPGESAYQIAVDEGFVGSESEWVASLKGDKGDSGSTSIPEIISGGFF